MPHPKAKGGEAVIDPFNPWPFGGTKFIESPDRPKVQLGTHPCVTKYGDVVEWISPEDRAKTNAWLLAFFGTTNVVPECTFYYSSMYGFAVGRPQDIAKLACV